MKKQTNKSYIDNKNKFIDLYCKQHKTLEEISQIYQCHTHTVSRILKNNNVVLRKPGEYFQYNQNPRETIKKSEYKKIKSMYLNDYLSLEQIAKQYQTKNSNVIKLVLKKMNVKIRKPGEVYNYIENPNAKIKKSEYGLIKKLYVEKKMSSYNIAKKYNCGHICILNVLKRQNIQIRDLQEAKSTHIAKNIVKSIIQEYNQNQISSIDISNQYGITVDRVLRILRNNNIHIRTQKEIKQTTSFQNKKRKIQIPKKDLEILYNEKLLSCTKIGKIYNVESARIKSLLKFYNIKRRSPNDIIYQIETIKRNYSRKEYKLPSGKIVKLQGYEPQFLDYVFKSKILSENDIDYSPKHIVYYDQDDKKHNYFPDFYVPKLNLIIEIKSWYTEKQDKNVEYKKQGCLNNNLDYIRILDNNFEGFERKVGFS